ncbi:HD domain-containing phosphohydrolase [Amantichitinum ursilacus]|uniref:Cyclic di-GMP phosphodiesterase response regulator RpfG n=1 Tax=Amantichitinum ursilacus TaxID=857265 RepID=A0A0N0GPH4_9NEIS|nr:HD domain-containing phosphohydrolase [Amantichitinum ursilacus]KPC53770.1 Cyclic di-GMP phosphodiesterase response regulator RpfG [Amantichitinum ursilacus]
MHGTSLLPELEHSALIPARDAIVAIAFIGDLSMGRATDQSPRTAWLAMALARTAGCSEDEIAAVEIAALLRWSGCTANAAGFERILGDDVAGREAMMALTLPPMSADAQSQMPEMAQIHCEVAGDIARMLDLGATIETALRHTFERYDGNGLPGGLRGDAVPLATYLVQLASDLEILSRAHGLPQALQLIAHRAGQVYPAQLAALLAQHAADWLAQLDAFSTQDSLLPPALNTVAQPVPLELVADIADLKLPWLAGYSRQVATLAQAVAQQLALEPAVARRLYRAGLIHNIGRAALPNALWNAAGPLAHAAWERVRLVPYWTRRAAQHTSALAAEAELASYAYERLDGSGYFRCVSGEAIPTERRILAAAVAWCALVSRRPWRAAHTPAEAAALLQAEAQAGRLDAHIVDTLIAHVTGQPSPQTRKASALLSERETDVLRRISLGESNKEVARALVISPSTVRTHMESIFRKLECSTRAAATLKAFTLGVL